MESLFRFILARPVQQSSPKNPKVPVRPSKEFGGQIKEAKASENPGPMLTRVAKTYIASADALHTIDDLNFGVSLQKFYGSIANNADKTLNELGTSIKKICDFSASDLIADAEFRRDLDRINNALIINIIFATDVLLDSDNCAKLLRAAAIISRVAIEDADLVANGGIAAALIAPLVLPKDIFPLTTRANSTTPAPQIPFKDTKDKIDQLTKQRDRLLSTYNVLTRIAPEHLRVATNTQSTEDNYSQQLSINSSSISHTSLPPIVSNENLEAVGLNQDSVEFENIREKITPSLSGTQVRFQAKPMLLREEVIAAFGAREKTVLEERRLDLTSVSLPVATDRLSIELGDIESELVELSAPPQTMMMKVGSSFVDASILEMGPVFKGAFSNSVPNTHGSLAPVGIGDLLVVKQNLKRYEARELAHVENVLIGEYKERIHSRSRTTEETISIETEIKKEEERDQQTTERFELKTESSQVQKEDTSLKIGLALSGKYGPVVEFKASTDFALNTSKEEASKIASSYSKDITTRATSRIFERRSEQRILKTIEVFEEKNTHGIDNKGGATHVIGQYQWIDKVYEAQVFNYGKRMLFDIMLPEPAAFLIHAMGNQPPVGMNLVKPDPFTLSPADISEWTYAYYVKKYEVLGVNPPPQPYITISKAFEGKGTQDDGATKAAEIPVSDGYQALSGTVTSWFNSWSGGTVDVSLGTRMHRFNNNDSWSPSLNNEVASVQFSMKTWHASAFALGVEIYCQRTTRNLDDWRLKTHAAILQGYQKLARDYEEKLAALQVQASQQILGRNPVENERLIHNEIKKGAISVFTAQQFDMFGAIINSTQGYPQIDLSEAQAEGKYIRFFEQAFEWEQMMYFFYPYYWGRKGNWLKRALMQDVDPLFAEFIKAGSARVVISARPGFEKAVAHYFSTGQIWDGGDLPDITSPLYVNIIEEIRERDKAPGDEVPQGDPWEVHLPTTLVILRDQAGLPKWEKNAQGEWLPVD